MSRLAPEVAAWGHAWCAPRPRAPAQQAHLGHVERRSRGRVEAPKQHTRHLLRIGVARVLATQLGQSPQHVRVAAHGLQFVCRRQGQSAPVRTGAQDERGQCAPTSAQRT